MLHKLGNCGTAIPRVGEGAFSSVYKVRRRSDKQDYALKKVYRSADSQVNLHGLQEREKEGALTEVRILASIEHDPALTA